LQTSKKYIGIIITLLTIVVLTSGCTYVDNFIKNPFSNPFVNSSSIYSVEDTSFYNAANVSTKSFSKYGVSFKYPSSWNVFSDNESGPTMIFASKDYSLNGVQLQVQIMPNNNMSEEQVVNEFHQSLTLGWTNTGSYKLTIDNKTAYEDVYRVNDTHYGNLMKIVTIALVKNDKTYLLLLQAPENEFDSEKPNFGVILKNFSVQ
jgi:hypothetical protein